MIEPIKIYFSVNKPVGQEEFSEIARVHNVQYVEVNQRNDKHFYIAAIEDPEEITAFLEKLTEKKAELLGSFNTNGLQYGKIKRIKDMATYDKDGETLTSETYEITGTAKHEFKKKDFIALMKDKKTYDVEGVELTSERPTKEKETNNFFGWGVSEFPE